MASAKLSAQDKKDLDKFTKFLALKSAQIIVQSRLGEKVQTQCKPHTSGTDWFNIAIQDLPDVLSEAKKALSGEVVTARLPLCIEISLRTVEGDQMILETWVLGVLPEQCDPAVRVTYTVYNRMGILLKSLISVTRVTPAYKLSRRQGPDSYVIYYRIYMGEPQLQNLGGGFKQVRVGQLCTPVGTLHISVAYRTKMTITPTNTSRDAIMLKSDHFHKDTSPKHVRYSKQATEKKVVDLDKPMRNAAFVDPTRIKQYTEQDYILPEEPPFSWMLLGKRKEDTLNKNPKKSISTENLLPNIYEKNSSCNNNDPNNANQYDEQLQEGTTPEETNVATDEIEGNTDKCGVNVVEPRKSRWTIPPENDKLMKELHFPFATTSSPIGELARFYRECYNAPPLQAFDEPVLTALDPICDVTKQLQQFEVSSNDFDSLVTSLCQSDNNNSNSN